jgi:hypothetical protein
MPTMTAPMALGWPIGRSSVLFQTTVNLEASGELGAEVVGWRWGSSVRETLAHASSATLSPTRSGLSSCDSIHPFPLLLIMT